MIPTCYVKNCSWKPPNKNPLRFSRQQVGTVPVDHAFNVKGVGVVVLRHSCLRRSPETRNTQCSARNKTAQVRSIQKHDEEFETCREGDRVGLAFKNVEVEDLDRGTVLTNDPAIKTSNKLKTTGLAGQVLANTH